MEVPHVTTSSKLLFNKVRKIVPPLLERFHKGTPPHLQQHRQSTPIDNPQDNMDVSL